ncbi:hypothetical protein GQ54DRAFT_297080 [Martensiomyces pterosporus]|nr:hypothetical protein GQ54DRAFT_297080 [Martensiomyces pterosporus]
MQSAAAAALLLLDFVRRLCSVDLGPSLYALVSMLGCVEGASDDKSAPGSMMGSLWNFLTMLTSTDGREVTTGDRAAIFSLDSSAATGLQPAPEIK